jgi:ketosteroid isomerase-like protein
MAIQIRRKPNNHGKETKMKRSGVVLMVLSVVLAFPVALFAQEADPEEVINAANAAWNAGDTATLKALYADGAVLCFPDWGDDCATVPGLSAEELGGWIEELVASNFEIEPESIEVEGDTVTVVAKVWADESRATGIAPLVTTDVYTVKDGLITSQTSTLSEESAAKLMAAMAAMEPETMPETGGEAVPAYAVLMVLGGLAVLGGLGLVLRPFSARRR